MKKLLIFLLVAMLAFFAYQYFFGKPKEVVVTKEVPVYTQEQYGVALRKIHDAVFADIDTTCPNPTANLQKLWGSAQQAIHDGTTPRHITDSVLRLCALLYDANLEREKREARLKDIRSKEYDAFTRRESRQKKQFYESVVQHKWKNYVDRVRPSCERLLKQLRVSEKDNGAPRTR